MAGTATRLEASVYQHLLERLSERAVAVGTHLKAGVIAKELGVSPATVRKAIDRLTSDGWVVKHSNGRPVVDSHPPAGAGASGEFTFANQTERVRDGILVRALRGEFEPGQVIKALPLAEVLDVSLPTVREALDWLCRDGVFVRLPRRGWQVASLHDGELRSIYEIRLRLEPLALSRAVETLSDEEVEALVEETRSLADAAGDLAPERHHAGDFRFHETFVEASGDSILRDVLRPLLRRTMLVVTLNRPLRSESFAEHLVVLEAVRRRDEPAAVEALEAHLRTALDAGLDR